MAASAPPVVDFAQEFKIDSSNVCNLLSRFELASDDISRLTLGNTIVREVTAHCVAEEDVLYPLMSRLGMGTEVAKDRSDHNKFKAFLTQAVLVRASDLISYSTYILKGGAGFVKHSKEEQEGGKLAKILGSLTEQENEILTKAFLNARTEALSEKQIAKVIGTGGKGAEEKVEYVELEQQHAPVV